MIGPELNVVDMLLLYDILDLMSPNWFRESLHGFTCSLSDITGKDLG